MEKHKSVEIEREDAFVALPTTEDELVFAISVKETEPKNAKLLYDHAEHALLLRNKKHALILDYLNSEVQDMLDNDRLDHIAEIDYKEKQLMRDYPVDVHFVEQYPFDLTPFCEDEFA